MQGLASDSASPARRRVRSQDVEAPENPVMIKIEAEGLQLATLTDVGRKRSGNEDSHAVWVSEEPAEFARRGALLVVAAPPCPTAPPAPVVAAPPIPVVTATLSNSARRSAAISTSCFYHSW